MKVQQKLSQQIIYGRLTGILNLIKAGKDVRQLEREIALLVLDILGALHIKSLSSREGCKCFLKIEYALGRKMESKLSEECIDLVNEGILFDEIQSSYGSDINLMHALATKILEREQRKIKQKFTESLIPA